MAILHKKRDTKTMTSAATINALRQLELNRQAYKLIQGIANWAKDGELVDGEEFDLPNDEAVDRLHEAIDSARAIVDS